MNTPPPFEKQREGERIGDVFRRCGCQPFGVGHRRPSRATALVALFDRRVSFRLPARAMAKMHPGFATRCDVHHTLAACGCLAGSWTPWRAVRGLKSAPIEGEHELFGFVTTEPNAVVAPIHPKAMPVILTTAAEVDLWLAADAPKALELQRPLPDDALRIVASGEKRGPGGRPGLSAFAWRSSAQRSA
jgi:hypothetical protein